MWRVERYGEILVPEIWHQSKTRYPKKKMLSTFAILMISIRQRKRIGLDS